MILLLRFVAWLFYPLSLCLELLLVGLLFLWFSKRQALGKVLVTVGTLLLLVFSFGPFGRLLLRPLEATYPPLLDVASLDQDNEKPVKWVVVLGAGYNPDPTVPATSRPSSTSLARFVEGIRLHRKLPGSKLLVLVGEDSQEGIRKRTVAELGEAFGVSASALVVKGGARDTAEEAAVITGTVGKERFVLVTSASHMPRAVRLCRDRGLNPIPAPTDYRTGPHEYAVLHSLPSPTNLGVCQEGFYEGLASVWRRLSR